MIYVCLYKPHCSPNLTHVLNTELTSCLRALESITFPWDLQTRHTKYGATALLKNTFTKTFLNAVILTSIISSRSMEKNFSRRGLLGKLDCRPIGHSRAQSPGILFSGVTERSTLFLSCSMIVVILGPIALFSSLSQRALPALVPPPAKRWEKGYGVVTRTFNNDFWTCVETLTPVTNPGSRSNEIDCPNRKLLHMRRRVQQTLKIVLYCWKNDLIFT